jgi:putative cell wall-binding protein
MTGLASTAQADWDTAGGQIGVVDTDPQPTGAVDNQGATTIYPGVDGQALGDVRLLIPNTFKNGDTIDLAIFDRTATADGTPANSSNGQINADVAHKLGFSGSPTATTDQQPYEATTINSDTDAAANTEYLPTKATTPGQASTPPKFRVSLVESSRANGLAKDIVRLTVDGVQAAGDSTDLWSVAISGLQADLGTAVSPGELRVVPFAYNGTPASDGSNVSTLFGNDADTDNLAGFDPTIATYTVPAFVSPVTFAGATDVQADGTVQNVGNLAISETNGYSLAASAAPVSYTVSIGGTSGATFANPDDVKVTLTNGGSAEVATLDTGASNANQLVFTLDAGTSNADLDSANTTKANVTISGIQLQSTNTKGSIVYTLSGGSVSGSNASFLPPFAGDSTLQVEYPAGGGTYVVDNDDAFGGAGNVNQDDIQSKPVQAAANSIAVQHRIGGSDRYDTAAKIAANLGSARYIVLASGEDFPDALSSVYLSRQLGNDGAVLLTRKNSVPKVTLDVMRRLGTHNVYVIGGTGAISSAVVKTLEAQPQWLPGGEVTDGQGKLRVTRLSGADRYATNRAVNEYAAAIFSGANPVGRTAIDFGSSSKLTALFATGDAFADAMAAGAAVGGNGSGNLPLILTKSGSLSASAAAQITSLGIEKGVVLGGTGAVGASTATAIETATGSPVYRIEGADRFATATALADWEIASATPSATAKGGLGFNGDEAFLANGDTYADALAGGPLAADWESPILLTKPNALSAPTQAWLEANGADYDAVIALGLGFAVSNSTLNAANQAISK